MHPTCSVRTHLLLFSALLAQGLSAQQPATPAPPTRPAEPCVLTMPPAISVNMESIPAMACDCRITAFKGTIYSRWGQEIFATEDPARFPGGLLDVKDLQPGSYFWSAEYTAIHVSEPVKRKATGFVNVL